MAGKLRKNSSITQSGNRSVEGSKILLKRVVLGGPQYWPYKLKGRGGVTRPISFAKNTKRMKKAAQKVLQLEAPYTSQRDITR